MSCGLERKREAGRAAAAKQKADAYEARGDIREVIMELLATGGVHRWASIVKATGVQPWNARAAMNDLHEDGEVRLVRHGYWMMASADPDGPLPVSRRDPNAPLRLTGGEVLALDHLSQWLVLHQAVTVAALEGLSERLQADTGCSRREADALIEEWLRALIDKGRVEVRGPLIRIKADRLGRPLLLRLVEAGNKGEDVDADDEEDDA